MNKFLQYCVMGAVAGATFLSQSFSQSEKSNEKAQWDERKKLYHEKITMRQHEIDSCIQKYEKKIQQETAELEKALNYNRKVYSNRLRELSESNAEFFVLEKESDSLKALVGEKNVSVRKRLQELDESMEEIQDVIHNGPELLAIKNKSDELDTKIEKKRIDIFKNDSTCAIHLGPRGRPKSDNPVKQK